MGIGVRRTNQEPLAAQGQEARKHGLRQAARTRPVGQCVQTSPPLHQEQVRANSADSRAPPTQTIREAWRSRVSGAHPSPRHRRRSAPPSATAKPGGAPAEGSSAPAPRDPGAKQNQDPPGPSQGRRNGPAPAGRPPQPEGSDDQNPALHQGPGPGSVTPQRQRGPHQQGHQGQEERAVSIRVGHGLDGCCAGPASPAPRRQPFSHRDLGCAWLRTCSRNMPRGRRRPHQRGNQVGAPRPHGDPKHLPRLNQDARARAAAATSLASGPKQVPKRDRQLQQQGLEPGVPGPESAGPAKGRGKVRVQGTQPGLDSGQGEPGIGPTRTIPGGAAVEIESLGQKDTGVSVTGWQPGRPNSSTRARP